MSMFHLSPSRVNFRGGRCLMVIGTEGETDQEIATLCDRSLGVSFPVFAKVEVNGRNAHPLYVWLKRQKPGLLGSAIKWNFTKFLLDRDGVVRGRYAPITKPEAMARDVAALL